LGLIHANRGLVLEQLIIMANQHYLISRTAIIDKIPTEWIPIRQGKRFVSAKVDHKSTVDFRGHVVLRDGTLPVAFDAKEVLDGDKWYLRNLGQHQYDYLEAQHDAYGYSFVLIGFWRLNRFYVLPFPALKKRWLAWKAGAGPAHVKAGDPELIEVRFPNYLDFCFLLPLKTALIERRGSYGTRNY